MKNKYKNYLLQMRKAIIEKGYIPEEAVNKMTDMQVIEHMLRHNCTGEIFIPEVN